MPSLMTKAELETRFRKGESPLALSIEKWERVVNNYEFALEHCYEFLYGDSCGLCKQYYKGLTNCCRNCPLRLVERGHCCKANSYWHYAISSQDEKQFLLNATAMLNALLQAKELIEKGGEKQL